MVEKSLYELVTSCILSACGPAQQNYMQTELGTIQDAAEIRHLFCLKQEKDIACL